jgi:hypothetical protein
VQICGGFKKEKFVFFFSCKLIYSLIEKENFSNNVLKKKIHIEKPYAI